MDIFGPYGEPGVMLMVFVAFLLDASLIPMLPELFIIVGFSYNPTPGFAVILVCLAIVAECLGNFLLYSAVERFGLPEFLKKIMNKYVNFLIFNDEKMLLVNRIAPMLPYSGAFISVIDDWKISRALFYVFIGCLLKYGVILALSSVFYQYFTNDVAIYMTFALVFGIIVISFIASYFRKKKHFKDVPTEELQQ